MLRPCGFTVLGLFEGKCVVGRGGERPEGETVLAHEVSVVDQPPNPRPPGRLRLLIQV